MRIEEVIVASSLLTLLEFDQNQNSTILRLYQYMSLKGYFKMIDHKFSEVGHAYLDSDRDFGRIEKKIEETRDYISSGAIPKSYKELW